MLAVESYTGSIEILAVKGYSLTNYVPCSVVAHEPVDTVLYFSSELPFGSEELTMLLDGLSIFIS